jgi:predicted nucleotidyltransferase
MFKKLNLFSRTEMKVLSFISKKDGELYERQIADGAKVSAGSANSILREFSEIGLILQERKGKMLFYQRNDANPLLRQFKVFSTVNELMPFAGSVAPLCSRIVLFGSCAEGRNGEGSDIDLLIITSEKEKVRRLSAENPRIQAILLDPAEYSQLEKKDKPLFSRIRSGIEIHGGDDG